LSFAATVAIDATSTAAADANGNADDIFLKLNNYFLINFGILGAAANDGMLAFWGQRRTKGCWRFGGMC